jgi:exodeoxyribonuclease VII small subunit
MTEKKTANNSKDKVSFEDALGRLEKIVAEMEGGELPLEANMKKFEEGMKLARFCTEKLGETEKKIEVLMKDSEQPEWQEMSESKPETPELDFG